MKRELRIEKIKKERYEQIIRAAEKLFARRGFGSTKISDIAKEAGVSHGLVYQYFESKELIFRRIVEEAFSQLDNVAKHFENTNLPAITIIEHTVEIAMAENRKFVDLKEYPYKFLIMIQAMSLESAHEILNVKETVENPLHNLLLPLIIRGQKEGDIIDGDPAMLTHSIESILLGIALSSIPPFQVKNLPTTEVILRMIKKGV